MSWRVWLAFAALSLLWGIPYFFIKLALHDLSPFVIAWSRIALGALILLPIAWQRGALRALRGRMRWICALAVVEFVIPFSAIPLGERWISSSVTAILIATVPLTIALLARIVGMHERLGARRLSGLLLGLFGVVVLVGLGSVSGPMAWLGVACMLVTALGYSGGPLIIQRHLLGLDPFGPVSLSLAIAALLLTLPAALSWPRHAPSALVWASIGVLGVACTAAGMLLWYYLIRHAGAVRASVITYINPAVATLLGTALLHEYVGLGGLLGLALIVVGSWLATRRSSAGRELRAE